MHASPYTTRPAADRFQLGSSRQRHARRVGRLVPRDGRADPLGAVARRRDLDAVETVGRVAELALGTFEQPRRLRRPAARELVEPGRDLDETLEPSPIGSDGAQPDLLPELMRPEEISAVEGRAAVGHEPAAILDRHGPVSRTGGRRVQPARRRARGSDEREYDGVLRSPPAIAVVAVAAAVILGDPGAARGDKESCGQCKFADCLKGLIAQKLAVAAGYESLAARFDKLITRDGKPIDVIDFTTLASDADRERSYVDANQKHGAYHEAASAMISAIGPPAGCGITELQAETDSFLTCETHGLAAAQATMPCKELDAILDGHEAIHRDACIKRKQGPTVHITSLRSELPGRMLTPAGNAREEAAAYRWEAAQIQPLYDQAKKGCRLSFTGVTLTCTIPTPVGDVVTGQTIIEATACGDPLTSSWTLTTESWTKGAAGSSSNRGKPWTNDCVAKGSDDEKRREAAYRRRPAGAGGWMCVYDKGPPERITIRNFPVKRCKPNADQAFTVDLTRSSEPCGAKEPPVKPPPPIKPTPAKPPVLVPVTPPR